jgi:hypothetical protein
VALTDLVLNNFELLKNIFFDQSDLLFYTGTSNDVLIKYFKGLLSLWNSFENGGLINVVNMCMVTSDFHCLMHREMCWNTAVLAQRLFCTNEFFL